MCLKTLNTIWVVFGTEQDVDCLLTPKTVSRGQQSLERVCEPRRWNATFAKTTTAKVHEETRLECLHEHKMKSLCQLGQCTNLHLSQQTDTFAVYGIHRTKIYVTAAVMVPLTIIPRPVIEKHQTF